MTLTHSGTITSIQALQIAREDALRAYREVDDFLIKIFRQPDGWHVDYEIEEPYTCGGGPHYIIDVQSGEITWKRYDQ